MNNSWIARVQNWMNTFLRPYNPKDFKNHTYITRQSILLLLAIPSTVSLLTIWCRNFVEFLSELIWLHIYYGIIIFFLQNKGLDCVELGLLILLKRSVTCTQPIVAVANLTKENQIPISFLDIHVTDVGLQGMNVLVVTRTLCLMNLTFQMIKLNPQ